jgi:pimeloyl-ACP methyl ester carboxylesterase
VFGVSSGAALALEAAAAGLAIDKLALWEPPFDPDEGRRPPRDLAERYERMIAGGRRGDIIEYFMANVVGLPPEFVARARSGPYWQDQEALAHTLVYDTSIMGDYSLPVERAAAVEVPTLALAGGESFPFMREAARKLAEAMPDARTRILEGQTHAVDPAVLSPVLGEFFGDRA